MIDLILVRVWFSLRLRALALNRRFFGSRYANEAWRRLTVFGLLVWHSQKKHFCKRMSIVLTSLPAATGSHPIGNRCHPMSMALRLMLILIGCSTIFDARVRGQDHLPSIDTATESKAEAQPSVDPEKKLDTVHPAEAKIGIEKRKKVVVGLAAIGGIAIFGIGGIAITMLWARRLRRLARELGPPQKTAGNDFWFLKPPKPTVAEAEIVDSHRPPQLPPTSESQE